MSSFKQLSKADVTSVSYAANKQWNLSFSCFPTSSEYITLYKGTNITGSFSPTEPTSSGQYERLIYDSINHLFYQEYTDVLNTGSLMFDVTTYESASQQRPTGAYFDYNTNPLLIKNFPTGTYQGNCIEYTINYVAGGGDVYYDYYNCASSSISIGPMTGGSQTFCALSGSVSILSGNYTLIDNGLCVASSSLTSIRVLVINQDIYGSKVLPNSFTLSSSAYYVTDDGYGNLYDSGSINGYVHIGNLFYAHGIGVITNQDYQGMFPSSSAACGPTPPTTTTTSTTSTTTTQPTTTTTTTTSTTSTTTTQPTTTSTTSTTTTQPTTTTTTTTSTTSTTTTQPTTTTTTTTSTTSTTTTCTPLPYSYALEYDTPSGLPTIIGFSSSDNACTLPTNTLTVYSTSNSFTVGAQLYYDICGTVPIKATPYSLSNPYYKYGTNYVTFELDGYTVRSIDPCGTTTTTTTTTSTTSTTTTAPTTTTTTTTSTTTTTTTLPACVSSVSFDVTVAGDVFIKNCCGLSQLNSYSIGSYTETICVPTDGTAITPVDATVTNIVYNLPACDCTTTTSTTTTTTTAGQQINIFLSDQFSTVCSGNVFNNVYIPQGSTFTTNTIVYYDSGCTSPMNNTNTYFYVVKNPSSGQTIYDWDGTTGTIGSAVGGC